MFFSLGEATSLGEVKSEFKPVKLRLKIDLVSYPARAEGLGKYIWNFSEKKQQHVYEWVYNIKELEIQKKNKTK